MAISKEALKQKARFELKEFLVIVLYLWVVFALFLLYKSVILNEKYISFLTQGFAIIDYILFHEYFHGDNGAGLGASHQTDGQDSLHGRSTCSLAVKRSTGLRLAKTNLPLGWFTSEWLEFDDGWENAFVGTELPRSLPGTIYLANLQMRTEDGLLNRSTDAQIGIFLT